MKVKIRDVRTIRHESVKAFFTLVLEDIGMSISDCKLVLTKDKQDFFIGFPSVQTDGRYQNFIYIDKDHKQGQEMQSEVLRLVLKELERQTA